MKSTGVRGHRQLHTHCSPSAWPSLEVWEYQDSGSPRLLFYNDASGRGILNTGWQQFALGSGK